MTYIPEYEDTPESNQDRARSAIARIRSSRAYTSIRAAFKQYCKTQPNPDGTVGLPCWICHKPIQYTAAHHGAKSFELDHDLPVAERPDLVLSWANFRPSHSVCNRRRGRVDSDPDDMSGLLGEPSEAW